MGPLINYIYRIRLPNWAFVIRLTQKLQLIIHTGKVDFGIVCICIVWCVLGIFGVLYAVVSERERERERDLYRVPQPPLIAKSQFRYVQKTTQHAFLSRFRSKYCTTKFHNIHPQNCTTKSQEERCRANTARHNLCYCIMKTTISSHKLSQ